MMRMTGMKGAAVAGNELGEGEAKEKARRTKRVIIITGLFVTGLFTGFLVGFHEARSLFDGTTGWPPAMALGIAAAYLAAMIAGSIALSRNMDELERQVQYKAGAAAAAIYVVVYPIWFALWKGGFVVEPIHWALFLLFWLALVLSSLYYRYR